jgi:hypothetical protein
MAEFNFALRYDLSPLEVKITARRHLADTLARGDNLGKLRAAEISP